MIAKRLADVTWEDIEQIVVNRVSESKTIEFKSQLPGASREAGKEMVRDVASFANAAGGDLIYGVKEFEQGVNKGRAEKITSITGQSADKEKLRLDNILRNGLAPPVTVQMKEIFDPKDTDGGFVLVVRILQSVLAPHMVTLGDSYRFFSRTSSGKFPMKDVGEIRQAFLASESQGERVRSFLRSRLASILGGEIPVPLSAGPRHVMHVIPLLDFSSRRRANFEGIDVRSAFAGLGLSSVRYNIDGLLATRSSRGDCKEYAQLHFDGTLEFVSLEFFSSSNGSSFHIASKSIEQETVLQVKSILRLMQSIEASLPLFIFSSLIGAQGTDLAVSSNRSHFGYVLDRDSVSFPETRIESWDTDVPSKMKLFFDSLWNAYGFSGSENFDAEGNWKLSI